MIDKFLKFTDKKEAESIFKELGITLSSGTHILDKQMLNIDILFGDGVIYLPTGELIDDGDGNMVEARSPADGYHVNIRYSGENLPEILEKKSIIPKHPVCVWA